MKKSILNIISLMCCLTIMLTATSCGNNAKKEEIVVDGIIPLISESELILRSDLIIEGTVSEIMDSKWSNPNNEKGENFRNVLQTDIVVNIDNYLFGERDDVVYDLGVLREEGVEVFHQPVGQPETLDNGEDHRDDRYQRHQRVERECRAADDGAVFEQAPRRIEQQPVLLHEPADHRVAPFADVAPEDRVRKIGEYFADFHKPFPFP